MTSDTNATAPESHALDASSADALAGIKRAIPVSRMLDYGLALEEANSLASLEAGRETWADLAERLGDRRVKLAEDCAQARDYASAGFHREQAAAAYNIGQLSYNLDTEHKASLYSKASAALVAQTLLPAADFKRLKLSSKDGKTLYGWEFPVEDAIGAIVVVGGLSGWGSSFFALARAFTRHRIAVVIADGPGQGESRLLSRLHLRPDTLPLFDPFFEHAKAISPNLGIFGNSFGGLIAVHLASARPDVTACCINCSPLRLMPPKFLAEREQIGAAFGAEGETLLALIEAFNLDTSRQRIGCPVLLFEGGADPVVAPGSQLAVLEAMTTLPPKLRHWADGLHALYNHAAERNAMAGAWFADRFAGPRERGSNLAGI